MSLGGAFGDIFSSAISAYSNHREAEQNRDWQELQRKTAYQDTVKDLTAAGLSPMLAYSKGPTSGGSGATAAPMQPLKLGETEQRSTQSELQREQANVAKTTSEVNEASAEKLRAETMNINQDTENKRLYPGMNQAQINELISRSSQHGASAGQLNALMDEIRQTIKLRKPEESFKEDHPTYSKYASPVMDALNTLFKGIGAFRGNSATINTTTTYPDGSKSTKTTTRGR